MKDSVLQNTFALMQVHASLHVCYVNIPKEKEKEIEREREVKKNNPELMFEGREWFYM